jgi:hypothetical protein
MELRTVIIVEKLIGGDLYYIGHSVSNIIIDRFTNRKGMLNEKNYLHHFIGNSNGDYGYFICN